MDIKIESNIPLPTRAAYSKRAEKYAALRLLNVGDSFAAGVKPAAMAVHARRIGKETGRKFVVRPEGEGSRVWRKA